MKKKGKVPRERLVQEIQFFLEDDQTLFVSAGSFFGPGLNRVLVTNEGGRVKVWADASSGSHFRFSKGGEQSHPDFVIDNLKPAESLADILDHKFWNQFNWGEIIAYQEDRNFRRRVSRRIKQLVAEFEEHAAKELNEIKRPPLHRK